MKIISGGQTGVDRAALDIALQLKIPCGGWCPQGRRAEDGSIPNRYPLIETDSPNYPVRTRWNVREADATLIFTRGTPDRGTALTRDIAKQLGKPHLVVDLDKPISISSIRKWLKENGVQTLNIAGPRESSQPGIYSQAAALLRQLLKPSRSRQKARPSVDSNKE